MEALAILLLLLGLTLGDVAVLRMGFPGSVDPVISASAVDARMRRGREEVGASPMTSALMSVFLGADAGALGLAMEALVISGMGGPSMVSVAVCEVSIASTKAKAAPAMLTDRCVSAGTFSSK